MEGATIATPLSYSFEIQISTSNIFIVEGTEVEDWHIQYGCDYSEIPPLYKGLERNFEDGEYPYDGIPSQMDIITIRTRWQQIAERLGQDQRKRRRRDERRNCDIKALHHKFTHSPALNPRQNVIATVSPPASQSDLTTLPQPPHHAKAKRASSCDYYITDHFYSCSCDREGENDSVPDLEPDESDNESHGCDEIDQCQNWRYNNIFHPTPTYPGLLQRYVVEAETKLPLLEDCDIEESDELDFLKKKALSSFQRENTSRAQYSARQSIRSQAPEQTQGKDNRLHGDVGGVGTNRPKIDFDSQPGLREHAPKKKTQKGNKGGGPKKGAGSGNGNAGSGGQGKGNETGGISGGAGAGGAGAPGGDDGDDKRGNDITVEDEASEEAERKKKGEEGEEENENENQRSQKEEEQEGEIRNSGEEKGKGRDKDEDLAIVGEKVETTGGAAATEGSETDPTRPQGDISAQTLLPNKSNSPSTQKSGGFFGWTFGMRASPNPKEELLEREKVEREEKQRIAEEEQEQIAKEEEQAAKAEEERIEREKQEQLQKYEAEQIQEKEGGGKHEINPPPVSKDHDGLPTQSKQKRVKKGNTKKTVEVELVKPVAIEEKDVEPDPPPKAPSPPVENSGPKSKWVTTSATTKNSKGAKKVKKVGIALAAVAETKAEESKALVVAEIEPVVTQSAPSPLAIEAPAKEEHSAEGSKLPIILPTPKSPSSNSFNVNNTPKWALQMATAFETQKSPGRNTSPVNGRLDSVMDITVVDAKLEAAAAATKREKQAETIPEPTPSAPTKADKNAKGTVKSLVSKFDKPGLATKDKKLRVKATKEKSPTPSPVLELEPQVRSESEAQANSKEEQAHPGTEADPESKYKTDTIQEPLVAAEPQLQTNTDSQSRGSAEPKLEQQIKLETSTTTTESEKKTSTEEASLTNEIQVTAGDPQGNPVDVSSGQPIPEPQILEPAPADPATTPDPPLEDHDGKNINVEKIDKVLSQDSDKADAKKKRGRKIRTEVDATGSSVKVVEVGLTDIFKLGKEVRKNKKDKAALKIPKKPTLVLPENDEPNVMNFLVPDTPQLEIASPVEINNLEQEKALSDKATGAAISTGTRAEPNPPVAADVSTAADIEPGDEDIVFEETEERQEYTSSGGWLFGFFGSSSKRTEPELEPKSQLEPEPEPVSAPEPEPAPEPVSAPDDEHYGEPKTNPEETETAEEPFAAVLKEVNVVEPKAVELQVALESEAVVQEQATEQSPKGELQPVEPTPETARKSYAPELASKETTSAKLGPAAPLATRDGKSKKSKDPREPKRNRSSSINEPQPPKRSSTFGIFGLTAGYGSDKKDRKSTENKRHSAMGVSRDWEGRARTKDGAHRSREKEKEKRRGKEQEKETLRGGSGEKQSAPARERGVVTATERKRKDVAAGETKEEMKARLEKEIKRRKRDERKAAEEAAKIKIDEERKNTEAGLRRQLEAHRKAQEKALIAKREEEKQAAKEEKRRLKEILIAKARTKMQEEERVKERREAEREIKRQDELKKAKIIRIEAEKELERSKNQHVKSLSKEKESHKHKRHRKAGEGEKAKEIFKDKDKHHSKSLRDIPKVNALNLDFLPLSSSGPMAPLTPPASDPDRIPSPISLETPISPTTLPFTDLEKEEQRRRQERRESRRQSRIIMVAAAEPTPPVSDGKATPDREENMNFLIRLEGNPTPPDEEEILRRERERRREEKRSMKGSMTPEEYEAKRAARKAEKEKAKAKAAEIEWKQKEDKDKKYRAKEKKEKEYKDKHETPEEKAARRAAKAARKQKDAKEKRDSPLKKPTKGVPSHSKAARILGEDEAIIASRPTGVSKSGTRGNSWWKRVF